MQFYVYAQFSHSTLRYNVSITQHNTVRVAQNSIKKRVYIYKTLRILRSGRRTTTRKGNTLRVSSRREETRALYRVQRKEKTGGGRRRSRRRRWGRHGRGPPGKKRTAHCDPGERGGHARLTLGFTLAIHRVHTHVNGRATPGPGCTCCTE